MPAAKVTNRTDYAVRAVLYLSLQEAGRVVPIPEIAAETGLSVKFLEEILLLLRTAGVVQSRRGKQGGYSLLQPPQELTVAQVVEALEGETPSRSDAETERRPFHRVTQAVFQSAAAAWWKHLAEIPMSRLVEDLRHREEDQQSVDMFHI